MEDMKPKKDRREQKRAYRAANVERISAYNREYREKHPEKARNWRAANTEKIREYSRVWRELNAGRRREYHRAWRAVNPRYFREYNAANAVTLREKKREYVAENAPKIAAKNTIGWLCYTGRLSSPCVCENCHKVAELDAHHSDYSKPLEVTWLCRFCHQRWHAAHGEGLNGATPPYYHFERRYKLKRKRLKAILKAFNKRQNGVLVHPYSIGV